MNDNIIKGTVVELQCQIFFTERGYNVYLPLSYDSKCDMIVDINGILKRIQIKTSNVNRNNTGIEFSTCHISSNTKGAIRKSYTKDDIDLFATYYNNEMYLIPIEHCKKRTKILSFKDSKYAQTTLLENYRGDIIIEKIKDGVVFSKFDINIDVPIGQYSTDGVLINKFNSIKDASMYISKPKASVSISRAVCGKRKTAYGYVWKILNK